MAVIIRYCAGMLRLLQCEDWRCLQTRRESMAALPGACSISWPFNADLAQHPLGSEAV
ncbi:MAG: hypothetical protein HY020_00930 [Burkholderiales bacterium]|nr:hypothetical protein [Burkholderiales bacterium]